MVFRVNQEFFLGLVGFWRHVWRFELPYLKKKTTTTPLNKKQNRREEEEEEEEKRRSPLAAAGFLSPPVFHLLSLS